MFQICLTLLVFGAKVCWTHKLFEEVIHDFPCIHPCLIYPLTLLQLLQFLPKTTSLYMYA